MAKTVFASGKYALAECDVCGQDVPYLSLRALTINSARTNILACKACWNADHPQYKTADTRSAEALRHPRPVKNEAQSREITSTDEYDRLMSGPIP